MSVNSPLRWHVAASYRTDDGILLIEQELEELEEIQEWVEALPDWNALIDIRITYARASLLPADLA